MFQVGDKVKVYGQVGPCGNTLGDTNEDVGYGYLRGAPGVVSEISDDSTYVRIGESEYSVHPKQLRRVKLKLPKVGTKVRPTKAFLDFHRGDYLRDGWAVPSGNTPETMYLDKNLREMLVIASADLHPLSGEVMGYGTEKDCIRVRLTNCFGEYDGYVGLDEMELDK